MQTLLAHIIQKTKMWSISENISKSHGVWHTWAILVYNLQQCFLITMRLENNTSSAWLHWLQYQHMLSLEWYLSRHLQRKRWHQCQQRTLHQCHRFYQIEACNLLNRCTKFLHLQYISGGSDNAEMCKYQCICLSILIVMC